MEVPGDTPEMDERCRNIERGGKLVTVTPSTFAVILQMPRGNIETIYPRALVLAGIRAFIDRKDYRSAFLACRSQMVDMNILHDYAPDQFMKNVQLFVDQVKKIDFVDEFISRLRYVVNSLCYLVNQIANLLLVMRTSRKRSTRILSRSLRLKLGLPHSRRRMLYPRATFLPRAAR